MKNKPTLDEMVVSLKKRYGITKLMFGNDLAKEISQIRGERVTNWKNYLTTVYNKNPIKVKVSGSVHPPKLPKLSTEEKAYKDKYWKSQRRKQS